MAKRNNTSGAEKKTKKEKVEITNEIPVISQYISMLNQKKYFQCYMSNISQLLFNIYDADESGRFEMKLDGNGTEEFPSVYLTKVDRPIWSLPVSISPSLELFLETNNALHLISESKPYSALYIRNGDSKAGEKMQNASEAEFAERYMSGAGTGDDKEGKNIADSLGELLARDYLATKKKKKDIEERLKLLKPMVIKELPDIETKTYSYSAGGEKYTLSLRSHPGGRKSLNRARFAELFGMQEVENFGVERRLRVLRVETEQEHEKRVEFMSRKRRADEAQYGDEYDDDADNEFGYGYEPSI